MYLEAPTSDEEAASASGKMYNAIYSQFFRNNWPRRLVIKGNEWTMIKDNGEIKFTGGDRDGGFSHYSETSLNRERSEVVEITEDSITQEATDMPPIEEEDVQAD